MTRLPLDQQTLDLARLRGDSEADALMASAVPEPWRLALSPDRVADVLGVASDQSFREAFVKLTSVPMLSQLPLGQLLLSATPPVARPLLASIVRHKLKSAGG